MESIKARMRYLMTPREHTDLQGEILNVIAAPIYVYTITNVYFYSHYYVMPYHHGNEYLPGQVVHDNSEGVGDFNWLLLGHRFILGMIYFQMMSNWLGIKYVDNSLSTAMRRQDYNAGRSLGGSTAALTSIMVNPDNNSPSRSKNNNRGDKPSPSLIPGPASAPPPPARQSYWSWKHCRKCNLSAPPRCHHCPMCDVCVLKRDHHCFFTSKCIGFYNQRHFIVFLIWASFGTAYSTLYFIPYYFRVVIPDMSSLWDIFPPFSFVRWMFGYTTFRVVNICVAFVFNALFVVLSTQFLVDQYSYVKTGLTQFETKSLNRRKLNIVDPRPLLNKVRAVLGLKYGLSFVFPLTHLISKPHENPFEWPELKIYRGQR